MRFVEIHWSYLYNVKITHSFKLLKFFFNLSNFTCYKLNVNRILEIEQSSDLKWHKWLFTCMFYNCHLTKQKYGNKKYSISFTAKSRGREKGHWIRVTKKLQNRALPQNDSLWPIRLHWGKPPFYPFLFHLLGIFKL